MIENALHCPEIDVIRRAVPEFEPAFQDELRAEEGEMGPFQAMSLFAAWVRARLDDGAAVDAIKRAFDAVERLAAEGDHPLGDPLVAEFIEAIGDDSRERTFQGRITLRRGTT